MRVSRTSDLATKGCLHFARILRLAMRSVRVSGRVDRNQKLYIKILSTHLQLINGIDLLTSHTYKDMRAGGEGNEVGVQNQPRRRLQPVNEKKVLVPK